MSSMGLSRGSTVNLRYGLLSTSRCLSRYRTPLPLLLVQRRSSSWEVSRELTGDQRTRSNMRLTIVCRHSTSGNSHSKLLMHSLSRRNSQVYSTTMKGSYSVKSSRRTTLSLIWRSLSTTSIESILTIVDLHLLGRRRWETLWSTRGRSRGSASSVIMDLTPDTMTESSMISERVRRGREWGSNRQ